MRVLPVFLTLPVLSLVACAFHHTLSTQELAVYERYALKEISKSVVEELDAEDIHKTCDGAGSNSLESLDFRNKVATAFEQVNAPVAGTILGVAYPIKDFQKLDEAIWSGDAERLAKSMDSMDAIAAYGHESGIELRKVIGKMVENMIEETRAPYKTVRAAARVPDGLESIVLLPEQQRDLRTITPTEIIPLKYVLLGKLPVPIRPGERPGRTLSKEQLEAMAVYRPVPGMDIVAQPTARLTPSQEIRIGAVAKEARLTQGLGYDPQKQADCLALLHASVASLLQKSPQGQAAVRKRAKFYLVLDGWRRGTEGQAPVPNTGLIGPISQQWYEPGLYYDVTRRSFGLLKQGYLDPITPDAYGPGIHSDGTGRPLMWQPQFGRSGFPDPTLRVNPNAYGPGIGMDQYGRPVKPSCPPGMTMC